MKKNKLITLLAVGLLLSTSALAGLIEHVSSSSLATQFDASGGAYNIGQMSINDTATLTIRYDDNTLSELTNTQFEMITSLFQDNSTGGIAMGLFQTGDLNIINNGVVLLTGSIDFIELMEVGNNLGMLSGYGEFSISGGSMINDLPFLTGDLVQMSFSIQPRVIDDFSDSFTGYSNISLVPVPEPATITLLGLSGLALLRRRR